MAVWLWGFFGSGKSHEAKVLGHVLENDIVEPEGNRMSVQAFYDDLAPLYHLVYEDWEVSVARQGKALASLIGDPP